MTQTCTKCSRANPPDAAYCYYDGMVLAGHGGNGGPVSVGSQRFGSEFVFPSGRRCRSFDELALACQQNWNEARDLLQQGFLQNFLGNLGRADLAMAAREAARFPDRDRALDQLLGKLPSDVLEAARLRAEPQEMSLGTLQVGQDRQFQLRLHNQGMRLLFGTVACEDCNWLAVGDGSGASQKVFQFANEIAIPVRVIGKQLRAGNKPLEGRLVIESNGGNVVVLVRADVPVKPFPDGVLAGAKSPRQVAEKAKASPKEAAGLFEKGAVAKWYESNGWTYPVQGPSASGLGAVQQFFEALGLTPAPKVDISERSLGLRGAPGQALRHTLKVETREKRPVYAHGTSNQPWLEVGKPLLNGRIATIPLSVPSVPNQPGQTLNAKVTVQANGNQRFVVPVSLVIQGSPAGGPAFRLEEPVPVVEAVEDAVPVVQAVTPARPPANAFDFASPAPVAAAPMPPAARPAPPTATTAQPDPFRMAPEAEPLVRRRPVKQGFSPIHLVPAGVLVLFLLGLLVWDLVARKATTVEAGGPTFGPTIGDGGPEAKSEENIVGVEFTDESKRFGITMLKADDPENPGKRKRLTFEERGDSNNTCIRIDGKEPLFGQRPGNWARDKRGFPMKLVPLPAPRRGWKSVWDFPEGIRCTQHVEIVVGEQTRLYDTVLVHYTLENISTAPHDVGLRVMLDTFIGANDGVPFMIPGDKPELVDTMKVYNQKDIPQYIQALEKPDFGDPGTVAHIGLKGFKLAGVELEPIERLVICRWPQNSEVRWKWDYKAMNDNADGGRAKDSCVVLYWAEDKMHPKRSRDMAFTYGLNKISSTGGAGSQLGLTVGGSFAKGSELTLTAYLKNAKPGQMAKVELPAGLKLAPGQAEEQPVLKGDPYSQVSWRLISQEVGKHTIKVSSGALSEQTTVEIRGSTVFSR